MEKSIKSIFLIFKREIYHLFNSKRFLFLFLIFTAIMAMTGAGLIRFAEWASTMGMDFRSSIRMMQQQHDLANIAPANLVVFLLSLPFMPFIVLAGSYDMFASTLSDRSIRHSALRCNRIYIVAGIFLAHSLSYLLLATGVQTLTSCFDMLMPPRPLFSEVINALGLGVLAWFSILPALALVMLMSALAHGHRTALVMASIALLIALYTGESAGPIAIFSKELYSALLLGFKELASSAHLLIIPIIFWYSASSLYIWKKDI